jgi:hypothetical protein
MGAQRWFQWVGQLQGRSCAVFCSTSARSRPGASGRHCPCRLENLIASSPAVIYVQRYADGALHSEFFSASLAPLLGWPADGELARQPGMAVHRMTGRCGWRAPATCCATARCAAVTACATSLVVTTGCTMKRACCVTT